MRVCMKARLVPLFFVPGRDDEFDRQVEALKGLLAEQAEILDPVALGSPLPEAEAIVFPQLVGVAYTQIGRLKEIRLPS